MTLFNHSLHFSEALYKSDPLSYRKLAQHGGFEYYETRVHGCTQPNDILQLDPDLRGDYPYAQAHYQQVGLACAKQVVWDLTAEVANQFPQHELSVYLFTDQINAVRPDPQRLSATKKYFNKNSFIKACQGKAPVPHTVFGWTGSAIPDYASVGLPLYVKSAVSSSGSSAYFCRTPKEVVENIKRMQGEYQLQAAVDAAAFLSVEYDLGAQGATYLADTTQLIDGVEYVGTQYPTRYTPHTVTGVIANQAAADGVKGKLGIDVAVTPTGQYFVLECNPRWNGAMYPMVIAQRVGATQWSTAHINTSPHRLKDVTLGDLAYDPRRKTGAIFVNWGAIKYNWLELLLIGSVDDQQELKAQLTKRLQRA